MTQKVILKNLPENIQDLIIDGDENKNLFEVVMRKTDKTLHILHKNLTYDSALETVSRYITKLNTKVI